MDPKKLEFLPKKTHDEIFRLYGPHSDAVKELRAAIREHVKQRLKLAQELFASANLIILGRLAYEELRHVEQTLDTLGEGDIRSVVSRYYYACYHAARAVCFEEKGIDQDIHEQLPKLLKEIPLFEARKHHEHLNLMRTMRRECDYSPFLEKASHLVKESTLNLPPKLVLLRWIFDAQSRTHQMLKDSIAWLQQRGYDFKEG